MTTLGIVGTGIAGLHLGLYLQRHGVAVTLYTDRTAAEIQGGRLTSTVALMAPTLARDAELGTDHWNRPEQGTSSVDLRVAGEPPLAFRGDIAAPWLFIDMRIYLPRLMQDFVERGGAIVPTPCAPGDLARLAAAHDLLVVASGRAGLTELFPRIAERSPYEQPQRRILGGLFRGVRLPVPFAMGFNIVPGHGEVFESQYLTGEGCATALLVEAIPGGALEPLTRMRYDDDPAAFNAAMLAIVKEYAPDTYARVDPAAFGLTRGLDTLSGAVVPVVRRGWAALEGGRCALALGDAHITHDPITGQGANAASRAARLVGERVLEHLGAGGRFDEAFCARVEQLVREDATAVIDWTNAFLQPPPPHALGLLVAASQSKAVADAFMTNFNDPKRQWEILSSPAATAAFLTGLGAALPAGPA